MQRFLAWFTDLYLLWLVGAAALAFFWPQSMLWFAGNWIVGALSITMLAMGFTLNLSDFRALTTMPGSVTLGFLCQYTVMPLVGWFVGWALGLQAEFAVGLILVASCPGGMASNMISYLAGANLALSIALTVASTALAFIATPLWMEYLAGQHVPVDALGLCLSTLKLVVAPVAIGVICNWRFPKVIGKISTFGPSVAVLALSMITGGIVAAAAPKIAENFGILVLAAFGIHFFGFGIGYLVPRFLRYPEQVARTVSIEVGMQNGGMAAMLASLHFTAQPLVAVPAVFSAVAQNIVGSLMATFWRSRAVPTTQEEGAVA